MSLQSHNNEQTPTNPSKISGHCQIKIGSAQVILQNGVDERIIQVIIRELMNQDVQNIYIVCGKTDMRKGIDGLATLIQDSFDIDLYGDCDSIFLFAGGKKDRCKCLYFDGDGFAMLY